MDSTGLLLATGILLFALALLPLLAIDEARGVATARRADEGARAGV